MIVLGHTLIITNVILARDYEMYSGALPIITPLKGGVGADNSSYSFKNKSELK